MKLIRREKSIEKGFTLVEIMAALGIIFTLSVVLLPHYNEARQRFTLLRSAYKLSQDLRRAQEMATSTKEFQGLIPAGYGIHVQQGRDDYLFYADTNPAAGNKEYDSGDGILENVNFEGRVYIKSVSVNPLSVNFEGPSPETTLSGGASSIMITLSLTNMPEEEQKIFVNQVGLIYVE